MAFGYSLFGADGSVEISTADGLIGEIYSATFPASFSGTVSVPEFDDTRGAITVIFISGAIEIVDPNTAHVAGCLLALPDVDWDNAAKTLTLAPANNPIPDAAPTDYIIKMVHYQ